MLTFSGVGAARGARTLFADLNLTVAPGSTWGLTGPNGAGKSTLLAIACGHKDPSLQVTGSVTVSPSDATIGWLTQEVSRTDETVAQFVARRTGVAEATEKMNDLASQLADGDNVGDLYATALDTWLNLGGADFEDRFARVSHDLGLDESCATLPMTALSGGQAARANLAVILLAGHSILLLDEPTNDLDLKGLSVLEKFVTGDFRPKMIVSHDREFLARTTTGIVELDSAQRTITVFEGGYESFLHERALARQRAREAYEAYAAKRDVLTSRIETQKNWLNKGVKSALHTSDNDKKLAGVKRDRTEKQAAKVSQSQRAIERLDKEAVPEPRKEWVLKMHIAQAPRSGRIVTQVSGVTVKHGDFTLGPVSLQVNFGDRVFITGANGAGKSTLIGLLTQKEHLGAGVEIGRIDQARRLFTGDKVTLVDRFQEQVPDWTPEEIRTLLAKYALGEHAATRALDGLSPGERTRASLALLQAKGTNFLVLDEPTNHLDLPAIEQLEQAVEVFNGTVVLVTHDRRMAAKFTWSRHLHVEGGTVTELQD